MLDDLDHDIAAAIRALANPTDLDRIRAYYDMLDAVGNNHNGTYRSVVISAIPPLGEILRGPTLVARLRTLDVLIDLVGSFEPDPAHVEVESPTGRRPLKAMVDEAAALLSDDVERLYRAPGSDEEERLAGELLGLLRPSGEPERART